MPEDDLEGVELLLSEPEPELVAWLEGRDCPDEEDC